MYYIYIIFFLYSAFISTTFSRNGDLYIHGEVVSEPCVLNLNSRNQTIEIGNVIKKTLYLHTRTIGYPFTIQLEECDTSLGNDVEISFIGDGDLILPELLAINGTAKGIAIGIETIDGEHIKINKSILRKKITNGKNIITINAYIQAYTAAIENNQIIDGDFTANLNLLINYP
ncbi:MULTISPECIES: fimbrial protein [unclassified Providencia]|uniref:fimbrial protein n=1 Tax=unclassified Providencia TaxID=2633465 RepID=UPI00234A77D0|nr:fimbrial protein [Providencia sp. PROV164]